MWLSLTIEVLLCAGLAWSIVMFVILAYGVTLWSVIAYHAFRILEEVLHMRWYSLADVVRRGRPEFFARRALLMLFDDEIIEARYAPDFFPAESSLRRPAGLPKPEGEDFIRVEGKFIEFRVILHLPSRRRRTRSRRKLAWTPDLVPA